MASSVIGALRVNLGLDSAQFSKGMSDAQKRLKVARTQFLSVAGAASAFGAALVAAAITGATEIDRLAKGARRLDTSIGGFRAIEMAAGEAGVSVSSLINDIQSMDREISIGGKNSTAALAKLGLAAKDLEGLEADQKMALLGDRIKEMGLTTGETSALLRDLGIRNREMVLALGAGGDMFRNARKDVEDYGLAISQVDSDAIETANDQMGRLGLVTQYVGQQLAIKLVPALGAMTEAFTNSLREGGYLRATIDGIIDNLGRMATYVATLTVGLGIKFLGALVAAKIGVLNLAGALTVLKGAIARTGIGLLVVGAGELVYWLGRVVAAAGGVSEALGRVGKVGLAVLIGVGDTAQGLVSIMAGVASSIAGSFLAAFAQIGSAWDGLLNGLGSAFEAVTGKSLGTSNVGGAVGGLADGLLAQGGEQISSGFESIVSAGRDVAAAVSESMQSVGDDLGDGASAADRLAESLDGVADSAGGGGAKGGKAGAAGKIKEIKPALTDLQRGFESFKASVASAFEGLITGAHSFKDALAGVLSSLANVFAQSAVSGLMGSFKLPGFATGTPYAPGGLAMVGERGPELINLPRGSQVLNANQTRGAMGGGGGVVRIVIEENEMFASRVRTEATGVAVEVTRKGISQNNRAQADTRYLRGGS